MAKSKRKSRRREGQKQKATDNDTQQATNPPQKHFQPDPPRPHLPVLIVSGALFGVWLVYLLIVAIFG